jgi:hypothetical protein
MAGGSGELAAQGSFSLRNTAGVTERLGATARNVARASVRECHWATVQRRRVREGGRQDEEVVERG